MGSGAGHAHGGSGDNFPIAEEDKEQEANEMSDEKVKTTNGGEKLTAKN